MRRKKWRGTILFAVIMVTMGATVGLRLYELGPAQTTTSATSGSTSGTTGTSTSAPSSNTVDNASGATPSSSATAAPTTASATKTISGAVEQNRYGSFQVQVTFEGSKITAVAVVRSPGDGRSRQINAQATPVLEQEALASQSANIDTVSGATYTSDSYRQSLQSAIDQL